MDHFNNPFLECLRHAGLVQVHRDDADGNVCFDLLPPPGVDQEVWAEQGAARMASFGYNAVRAPRWEEASGSSELFEVRDTLWRFAETVHACDDGSLDDAILEFSSKVGMDSLVSLLSQWNRMYD